MQTRRPLIKDQIYNPPSLIQITSTSTSTIPNKLFTRPLNNRRRLLHLFLRQFIISSFDCVSNGREISFVVAGPELGAEDYVFELCAVGDLSYRQ
jgi:hypothetical protein